jgi:MYXO-CTERM domain-containing protein
MGTLLINNAVNLSGATSLEYFKQPAGSITLSANSNVVFPPDVYNVTSGTLSPDVPEPTGLGIAVIAALAFLRRRFRK